MLRVAVASVLIFAAGCAPPALRNLPPSEQRRLGDAAVSDVCGYGLDAESNISLRQRHQLDVARQYLDEIVAYDVAAGELSRFFSSGTLSACAVDLEWGGVNYDVQRLVQRYGTDAEKHDLERRQCEIYAAHRRPDEICVALGFPGRQDR